MCTWYTECTMFTGRDQQRVHRHARLLAKALARTWIPGERRCRRPRRAYAQARYEDLTGWKASAAGGPRRSPRVQVRPGVARRTESGGTPGAAMGAALQRGEALERVGVLLGHEDERGGGVGRAGPALLPSFDGAHGHADHVREDGP